MNKEAMANYLKKAKVDSGLSFEQIAERVGKKSRTVEYWFDPKKDSIMNVELIKLLEPVLGIDHRDVIMAGLQGDENYDVDQSAKNKYGGIAQGGREANRNRFMHVAESDELQEFKERYFKKSDEVDSLNLEIKELTKTVTAQAIEIERLKKENEELKKYKS